MDDTSEFKKELLLHLSKHGIHEDMVTDFKMLENLSPTRNQKGTQTCLIIATIASLEVLLRSHGIHVVNWDKIYYLDILEALDRLYKLHPVGEGIGPFGLEVVMRFAKDHGFNVTSIFKKLRPVDKLAKPIFDEPRRCRIHGYKQIGIAEVLDRAGKSPVIAAIYSHRSMITCKQAMYRGPNDYEKQTLLNCNSYHVVLVVGKMTIDGKIHLIVQDSWGPTCGYFGFLIISIDGTDFFKDFMVLEIDLETFTKTQNGTLQFVESHPSGVLQVVGDLHGDRMDVGGCSMGSMPEN